MYAVSCDTSTVTLPRDGDASRSPNGHSFDTWPHGTVSAGLRDAGQMEHGPVKILIVDDERDILDMARAHLTDQGYRVITAADAAAALQALEVNPDVALLFTDIAMPGGLDGFELAIRAKRMHPGIRVLYTSGFLKDEGVWHGSLLQKPWRLSHLDEAVKRALD